MLGVPTPLLQLRRLLPRPAVAFLVLVALAPVFFVAAQIAPTVRNIVYWDEFDTALNLVLQLDDGVGVRGFFSRLFEISNEHRMVTSRLMFAASYWLTGTVNFSIINLIGNASIVALCVLLIVVAGTTARRVRLGVVLAMTLFQLEHYENFLWSGSSIDHFQVVLLAAAALVGVARGTPRSLLAGALAATLATFTLAHGTLVWVVGAAMLWRERRFAHLRDWSMFGAFALAGFLAGFQLNTAQRFAEPSFAGAVLVARYWLTLLGAVPALGNTEAAPWLGGALLVALAWLASRGAARREILALSIAGYAVLALALIAAGRAAESGGLVHSRYLVLGALAWALAAFLWLERVTHPRRPYAVVLACLPLLVAFNVAANHAFAAQADSWLESRDRAALRFKQRGADGHGPFRLYPMPTRSTQLLAEAERRGIYRMATICETRAFPDAAPSGRIAYFVEEFTVDERAAFIGGWAALAGEPARRGQLHIVLRSQDETHIFTTVTATRPDVADAFKQEDWRLSGFTFARRRDRLPSGEYQLGFLIADDDHAEYIMTEHRLQLVGEGKALLASAD